MTEAAPEFPSLLPGTLTTTAGVARPRRSTRDWLVDSVCFLIALAFAVLVITVRLRSDGPDNHLVWLEPLDGAVGVLAAFALWLRRRWPVTLALAVALLTDTLLGSTLVAFLIMMFTVAVHRRVAVTVAVSTVGVVVSLVATWVRRTGHGPIWPLVLVVGVPVGLTVAWGILVRSRRQLIVSLREQAERAETEQRLRVTQARQRERTRIAREMHDVLAHRITLLSLHAGALERASEAQAEEITRAAGVIRGSAHAALQDLRQVIGVLRADAPEDGSDPGPVSGPAPGLVDVAALVDECRSTGMLVELRDRVADPGGVPDPVGRAVYRVVQEGLANARRHAPGAATTVDLVGGPGAGLTVTVRNPMPAGRPVDRTGPSDGGTGLVGVTERVALAGGRAEHGPDGRGHHRLTATLPWPAPQDSA